MKLLCALTAALVQFSAIAFAQPQGWQYSGELTILTTPEGANLAAGATIENFPLLVRLHKDWFDFSQAKPGGQDIRFSNSDNVALPFQIEEWNAAEGNASIWVKVPKIIGNTRQQLKLFWGKADAQSESNPKAVFHEANGYFGVWHMSETVADETGTLESKDTGTTLTGGIVGKARHFPGQKGVFCGDKLANLPAGDAPHTTEMWFRAERPNTTIIGWGNEGTGRGAKVRMQFRSPAHIKIDSEFSDINTEGRLPQGEWIHVVHTYGGGPRRLYINGQINGEANTKLDIKTPARLWLGGWYNSYDFVGDLDEVRLSRVARSPEWIRLEYENQKPLQTLVGPIVQPGAAFSLSATKLTVPEGQSATITAQAGGAQKLFWVLRRDGAEQIVATDRLQYRFEAGRVSGNQTAVLQLRAIYPDGVKTQEVALTVREAIAEPQFALKAPARWDGRTPVEVVPQIKNLAAMKAAGAGEVQLNWSVGPFAVIKEGAPGKLRLLRALNSGPLTVTASVSNGGATTSQSVVVNVAEPRSDAWAVRLPDKDEKPEEGQFYARDDKNEGTLFYNGTLETPADSVFLRVFADDKPFSNQARKPGKDKSYTFAVKLKPGLIKYKVEFGSIASGAETVLRTVNNIVCGDAFLIDGQSNALATDTAEKAPPETSEWIRSYGRPNGTSKNGQENLWCNPVWKAQNGEKAELGWWGMELAKRLVDSNKVPIFIINAAVGGTRIDQHQRSATDPTDLSTIYGRMLWRVQGAKLTHGIRGILWHQGENDQGADGPGGGYGWESYQKYFLDMAAAWKQDFPNVQHYYIFQIWPNSCAMGGSNGNGDRLREKQRTLPFLFSNMSIMSTLGVRPPGGCHFPLVGWAEFARLIQPVIERDHYGKVPTAPVTAPNLRRAMWNAARDGITLEFDQPVAWDEKLASQFYLDGEKDKIASGSTTGNVLTLKLKAPGVAKTITYLKEANWNQDTLLLGANGIAALTFCEVPILPANAGTKKP